MNQDLIDFLLGRLEVIPLGVSVTGNGSEVLRLEWHTLDIYTG